MLTRDGGWAKRSVGVGKKESQIKGCNTSKWMENSNSKY